MRIRKGFLWMVCLLAGILVQLPFYGIQAEAAYRTVYFGSYYQDLVEDEDIKKVLWDAEWKDDKTVCRGVQVGRRNRKYYIKTPIEWIVLRESGGVMTLLAKNVLDYRAFGDNFWVYSDIRTWLNQDFLQTAFSTGEQSGIVNTTVESWYHPYEDAYIKREKGSMITTTDKVYLLSDDEVDSLNGGTVDLPDIRLANATQLVDDNQEPATWWLRSKASWNYGNLQNTYVSRRDPGALKHWYGTWGEGIRPVIRVLSATPGISNTKTTVKIPKYCSIQFDRNDAPRGKMSMIQDYEIGTVRRLPANQFKWEGFKFQGWNTKPDGTGTAVKNKGNVAVLEAKEGDTITLYAQWKGFGFLTNMVTLKEKGTITKNTLGSKATYKSSDTSIFKVNKKTGVITPKKNGMATLTMKVKTKTVKQSVVVNHDSSWKSYHIKEQLEGLTQAKENKTDTMCPQGICVTSNYILISAYNSDELYPKNKSVKHSLIYVMNKDGSYRGCFDVGTNKHVGGMAYDPNNGLVFVANGSKIQYFSEWNIERYLQNGKIDAVRNITKRKTKMQISTLTWHKDALWVVYCVQKPSVHQSDVLCISYQVKNDKNGECVVKAQKEYVSKINDTNYINGVVFVSDTSDTMLLTRSPGRNRGSQIYYVKIGKEDVKNKKIPTAKLRMNIPSMAEGMAVMGGRLLTLFESSSDLFSVPYKKGKAEKSPMDYLTVFNIAKWK